MILYKKIKNFLLLVLIHLYLGILKLALILVYWLIFL